MIRLMTAQAKTDLEKSLADIKTLESSIFPELKAVLEDLGYTDATVLVASSGRHPRGIDTFEIDTDRGTIEVVFASATATGDYSVTVYEGSEAVDHQMVGRPDLIDIIESYLYAMKG